MSNLKLLLALPVFCCLTTAPAMAEDLVEVLELALAADPTLREADANRLAALEAKPQARSALLPQFNATGGLTDSESNGIFTFPQAIPGGGVVVVQASQEAESFARQWELRLQQSLFRWDQWVRLAQADKRVAQAEADYRLAIENLILRTSQAYFAVLSASDTLQSTQATKEAIGRQLEQAETRFEVGLTAITDVHEAQAAYDEAVAGEIQAKRELATAREQLREITGTYLSSFEKPSDSLPLVTPNPATVAEWVDMAMEQNIALTSSRLGVDIAKDDVKVSRSNRYPTLDFFASRSRRNTDATQSNNDSPFFPADSDNFNDSIGLQFSVPIYTGGNNSSLIRQAVYQHRAARERLERVARETERRTRDSYLGVLADISRVQALKRALISAETALKATEAGFDVGTRTTVDVLNSRRQLFSAQTNYFISRYDYIINVLTLKQAAGGLSRTDIEGINQWLE